MGKRDRGKGGESLLKVVKRKEGTEREERKHFSPKGIRERKGEERGKETLLKGKKEEGKKRRLSPKKRDEDEREGYQATEFLFRGQERWRGRKDEDTCTYDNACKKKGKKLQNILEIAVPHTTEKGSSLNGALREGRKGEVEAALTHEVRLTASPHATVLSRAGLYEDLVPRVAGFSEHLHSFLHQLFVV